MKRTEIQIAYYSLNPSTITSLSLLSINRDLYILRSIYAYKNETLGFHKKINALDSLFGRLLISKPLKKEGIDSVNVVKQVEQLFKKREGEIIGLKMENQTLRKQNYLLRMDTVRWCEKFRNEKKTEAKYKSENNKLQNRLKLYEHGTYWGLSLGFNYFFNNPPNYYIKADSTIGIIGAAKGISFLISAIIGYKFNPRHSIIFNLPLGDFTNNSQNAIGLFNQKLAGGLGYGYHISGVSIIAIINLSPYEKIAPELLNEKIEGDLYSKIDLKNYPTSTAYSPSFTLGMSYNFLGKPALVGGVAE